MHNINKFNGKMFVIQLHILLLVKFSLIFRKDIPKSTQAEKKRKINESD